MNKAIKSTKEMTEKKPKMSCEVHTYSVTVTPVTVTSRLP